MGLSRQDVASYLNRSDWGNSGWSLNYNVGNLAAGSHTITAVAYDSQGAAGQLSNNGGTTFTVTPTTDTPPTGYVDEAVNASDGGKSVPQGGTLFVRGWA